MSTSTTLRSRSDLNHPLSVTLCMSTRAAISLPLFMLTASRTGALTSSLFDRQSPDREGQRHNLVRARSQTLESAGTAVITESPASSASPAFFEHQEGARTVQCIGHLPGQAPSDEGAPPTASSTTSSANTLSHEQCASASSHPPGARPFPGLHGRSLSDTVQRTQAAPIVLGTTNQISPRRRASASFLVLSPVQIDIDEPLFAAVLPYLSTEELEAHSESAYQGGKEFVTVSGGAFHEDKHSENPSDSSTAEKWPSSLKSRRVRPPPIVIPQRTSSQISRLGVVDRGADTAKQGLGEGRSSRRPSIRGRPPAAPSQALARSLRRAASQSALPSACATMAADGSSGSSSGAGLGIGMSRAGGNASSSSLTVGGSSHDSWRRPSMVSSGSRGWDSEGDEEDFEEILATPGVSAGIPVGRAGSAALARKSSASSIASSASGLSSSTSHGIQSRACRRVPAALDISESHLVSPSLQNSPRSRSGFSSNSGDDLPGAKARKLLGIKSSSGFDVSPNADSFNEGYASSSSKGSSRLGLKAAFKSKRSSKAALSSTSRMFGRHSGQASADGTGPPSTQNALTSPGSDASFAQRQRDSSENNSLSPSYSQESAFSTSSYPASPSMASAYSGHSSTGVPSPAPASATRASFALGRRERKVRHKLAKDVLREIERPATSSSSRAVSAIDEALWERELAAAESNASWQTSIEHRPRRPPMTNRGSTQSSQSLGMLASGSISSTDRAVNPLQHALRRPEDDSDDERWMTRGSRERQLSSSSAGSITGGRPVFDRQRRPSFDPNPLPLSMSRSSSATDLQELVRSSSSSSQPSQGRLAQWATPVRPPRSHARADSQASANSVEYIAPSQSFTASRYPHRIPLGAFRATAGKAATSQSHDINAPLHSPAFSQSSGGKSPSWDDTSGRGSANVSIRSRTSQESVQRSPVYRNAFERTPKKSSASLPSIGPEASPAPTDALAAAGWTAFPSNVVKHDQAKAQSSSSLPGNVSTEDLDLLLDQRSPLSPSSHLRKPSNEDVSLMLNAARVRRPSKSSDTVPSISVPSDAVSEFERDFDADSDAHATINGNDGDGDGVILLQLARNTFQLDDDARLSFPSSAVSEVDNMSIRSGSSSDGEGNMGGVRLRTSTILDDKDEEDEVDYAKALTSLSGIQIDASSGLSSKSANALPESTPTPTPMAANASTRSFAAQQRSPQDRDLTAPLKTRKSPLEDLPAEEENSGDEYDAAVNKTPMPT
ncbi:hypothetical protein CBOM_01533 [Ceraceosorus bombacis]|uniref:Uncharacterized protein n=1 Tax=Ceraceosorus bombacis TaxID=401625 RepID=A0A0P1BC62_9BASI|nr:hypothetical protein CBOM_01533 [Ceraceosorus bombacis]